MRRLLLLRHAKAEKSEPGTKDFARVLIDRGRKDAAKIGAYMAAHALVPDRVILSPAARTQETWKYAAAAFHPAPAAMSAEKIYDATPHSILAVIKDAPAAAHTLMVIGHNPGLYELALMLIAAGRRRCARAAAREAADLGAGHHRLRLRQLEQTASAVRPAGALHQPEVAGSHGQLERSTLLIMVGG